MAYSVLLCIVWEIRIGIFHQSEAKVKKGIWEQNVHSTLQTNWKSKKNGTEKQCQIVCGFLFGLCKCLTSSGCAPHLSKVLGVKKELLLEDFFLRVCPSVDELPLLVFPAKRHKLCKAFAQWNDNLVKWRVWWLIPQWVKDESVVVLELSGPFVWREKKRGDHRIRMHLFVLHLKAISPHCHNF